jgi:hypothetical protein
MNKKNVAAALAVLALCGCGTGGAALAVTIVTVSVYQASDFKWQVEEGGDPRRAPPMAPDRKVNEVDCTQPIDHSLGNIRCK